MSIIDRIFVASQYGLPQHLLSRTAGLFAESEIAPLKNSLIKTFIRAFGVDMDEALYPAPDSYRNFNDFFTRPLKSGARSIDLEANVICCPADGSVSQLGSIQQGQLIQAKGRTYSVRALLGGDAAASRNFEAGSFATIYLSPKDYHRVHMPFGGRLTEMVYVPGKLFSVNGATAEYVNNLFAINERVVAHFETDIGPMVVVLVGAMIVAGIETKWHGPVAPNATRGIETLFYQDKIINFSKGEEMGRFKLGSTAIILFPEDTVAWDDEVFPGQSVKMGQRLGVCKSI